MSANGKQVLNNALLVSLCYGFFGISWVILSDKTLLYEEKIVGAEKMQAGMLLDILFVLCSAVLIFLFIYRFNKRHSLSLQAQLYAQQAILEKSERRFKTVIENTQDIISLIDKDGNVIYVNPTLEKLTGFTLEEVRGKSFYDIMHPDYVNDSKRALKQLLDNPELIVPRTNRFLNKKTGDYIWLQGTAINLLGDESVGAIISNYRDITEKKLIEQQIIFEHNNLKALINNTSDLMWSIDKNFKLITSNKAFDDAVLFLSGRSIKRGDHVLETGFADETLNRFKTYYERAFLGKTFTEIEHEKYPVESWSEISFYPIYYQDVVIGTACFVKDITGRKQNEMQLVQFTKELIRIKNKLEQNEFKLKQAQAIAQVGSWELDYATEITTWSEETCRIYGVPVEENKQPYEIWKSFIHPEDVKHVLETIKESYDFLNPPYFHYRIIRKDGTVRYIYSKAHYVLNTNKEITGLHGVTYDITEQKLAEQEILQKNRELRDLTNHLQHIREEERAFIAREIHDELGQQLTVLKMDIDWIMRKQNNPDERVVLKLQDMLQLSDHLISTIRKISSDLRPAIIDDLGLVAALEWICDDFEIKTDIPCRFTSTIKERKFEEVFSIAVYRILQESLTNILRHAGAKSVTVLATEKEDELCLEVTDDGRGISTENIRKGKTLGVLGMKERAALFGGELIITGASNKGTKVKLILPLKNELHCN